MRLQHVAHCDVKPSNILWVQLSKRAVLCDFSLTADWTEQATPWALCALNYSPPEALVPGPYRVSGAADVWAFGCTMWEVGSLRAVAALPAGREPAARPLLFPGRSGQEVQSSHARFAEAGRARAFRAAPVDGIVLAYCEREPAQRVLDRPLC